jgi:4-amino-4-deoxy-L-arabinose transferase-like glycosyltransferase
MAALRLVEQRGYTLYYGDAEAHLNHARRLFDSRTPGFDQLGTPWLPLPHLLMLPLVSDDRLWRSGLAGAIPSAVCFVLAGAFLFAAAKSVFSSRAAGAAAAASFALNPNLLYLQSTPMTEPVFLACLMAVLYFTVRFGRTQSPVWVAAAGMAASAGALTRYEGWFLVPFVAIYVLIAARRRRLLLALIFSLLALTGPLAWLAHNWWYTGDALSFYRGPTSAKAIQGAATYPGDHNWALAWLQFRTAAALVIGPALLFMGLAGVLAALLKRAIWPLALLSLTPAFYVWSVHSGIIPIFVPSLYPFSYYNTRYGLAALPLAAFAVAALVAWAPLRLRAIAAVAVIGIGLAPWLMRPRMENVLTWKESEVNSVARRAWTGQAAEFLRANYRPGSGVFTTFGDISGIFRQAGVPLRDTLTWDNWPYWPAAVARPDLFLREEWAVAIAGDPVQSVVNRAYLRGPRYTLQKIVMVKGADVVEIYRRDSHRGLTTGSP